MDDDNYQRISAITQPMDPSHSPTLNLETLEADPAPTFVIKVDSRPLPFEFLFCNDAFRNTKSLFRKDILVKSSDALLFRSWAQALGEYRPTYEFANQRWSGIRTGRDRAWKVIRAIGPLPKKQNSQGHPTTERPKDFVEANRVDKQISLRNIPPKNLAIRLESFQMMMEISDVGVFEFDTAGKLLHANEAFLRLSSWPRNFPAEQMYTFMDLIHPDDHDLVMSKWNYLVEGHPIYFEMRWKAPPGSDESAQWIISATVPVFKNGKLVSVAGNNIDINQQKKAQQVAQERVEAMEQVRLSELKFARFAQLSPIAIGIFIPGVGMSYVNDRFFELTGHPRVPPDQIEWFDLVAEQDLGKVKDDWARMLAGQKSNGVQFRLKKPWLNRDNIWSNVWVQCSGHPELDECGKVLSIMVTLFDISQFKWAEKVQRRRIEEAFEAKRQQENFIDMTSHELRNPLSAIIQSADLAINFLQQLSTDEWSPNSKGANAIKTHAEVSACIESLRTIVSCSLHQKRIIDDVLTLSKLDSKLIEITPVRVQPSIVVSDAMRMFEVECSQTDISLIFREHESFRGMEWVMLDPSRLLQILINLLNAIKFTKGRPKRAITVTLGGTRQRPPKFWQDINFVYNERLAPDIFDKEGWGNGHKIYIWLKITDTGCGMTEEEQKMLFGKFAQATPRTHIKYGGSGLGLFISKSLSNLQGGGIGAKSERDVGSTFAFYVGARLAEPPSVYQGGKLQSATDPTSTFEEAMKKVKLNILIVEDNLINQKVLKKRLHMFGWNISVAGNGEEALDWLKGSIYWTKNEGEEHCESSTIAGMDNHGVANRKHELDIILMDVEMPVMDGLACTRIIRDYEHSGLLAYPSPPQSQVDSNNLISIVPAFESSIDAERLAQISPKPRLRLPILAVSANARSEQIKHALAAGVDDAISKPFRVVELWPKICNLVKGVADGETVVAGE